jgi:hypothetical protein
MHARAFSVDNFLKFQRSFNGILFVIFISAIIQYAPARADINAVNSPAQLRVETEYLAFHLDPSNGLWDAWDAGSKPIIMNASCLWSVSSRGKKKMLALAGHNKFSIDVKNFVDKTGEGRMAAVSYSYGDPAVGIAVIFRFYNGKPFFTVVQKIENKGDSPLLISHTLPLQADKEHFGGFFGGPDPKDVWALENGNRFFFDFFVRIVPGTEPVFSNWNTAYYDRATSRTVMIGFLTADKGKISVRSYYNPDESVTEKGWRGFSSIKAQVEYDPSISVPPKKSFEGERLYIGVSAEPQPHPTLERFADAVADQYGIRIGARETPNGWNSWATKYDHDLTEENMLENARWAAEHLLPYGMNTFQIDDNWQVGRGDWEPNEKFPHGMKWMADQIHKLGFTPGLWIAPFSVSPDSSIARQHPDWIAPKNKLAETLMPKDELILDLTHPEVKEWLGALFRRIGHEWGMKVIKIDFIYYAQHAKQYHDPNATGVEAFREGLRIIREALPDDAFLIAVAVPVVYGVGYADGMRLGLDIKPAWGDEEGPGGQGIKPMVRNLARRYYLGRRVWINHPDMFYLGSPEEMTRWDGNRVTLEEARTYATLASLEGGIVKIGDSFVGLDDTQTDLLRRVLPAFPGVARPLDLFEHTYPEIWHLPIRNNIINSDVVAFFNWGKNRRWGAIEEEREKTIEIPLAGLGLDPSKKYAAAEFWSGEPLGVIGGAPDSSLKDTLPPRTVRAYAVRQIAEEPMFLSTSRHITQGATDIEELLWNPVKKTLSCRFNAVADFKYMLTFYVPEQYRFLYAATDKWPLRFEAKDNFLKVWLKEPVSGERTLNLAFGDADAGIKIENSGQ